MNWKKVLNKELNFNVLAQALPSKGSLVYEYNPFRNYRLSQDMFEYKGLLYTLEDLETIHNIKPTETDTDKVFINTITNEIIPDNEIILREAGELVDFITDELKFDLEHPVNILPLYSYDGSVNLILNDGKNKPKLINSRFSATGKNTYEIVDRSGSTDTNIYDLGTLFETDTSLYKTSSTIPKLEYLGTFTGGNMSVGNYHFYFKCSDEDGNETDFIAESGLVSVFIGFGDPKSMHTGEANNNSYKTVNFSLSNLDTAYDYITVYYTHYTALNSLNLITEYKKITKKFQCVDGHCSIVITGFELTLDIPSYEINLLYNVVDKAKTLIECLNMLFLGNVQNPEIPYDELLDLSLRIYPYLKEEEYGLSMNHNYVRYSKMAGYYDSKFIYNKTGYWGEELYRFGIVYILHNNELSPVFNVRGKLNITEFNEENQQFTHVPIYENDLRVFVKYSEKTNLISEIDYENIKGVCSFKPDKDTNTIYSVDFRFDEKFINEIKKYAKGFFFVRLARMPLKLMQGVTIGIDKVSRTPCIATQGGFLADIATSLNGSTHVETEDINGINYISEGFLNRYSFEIKPKKKNFWALIGTAVAIAVIAVAGVVGSVFTGGAAGVGAGAAIVALTSTVVTAGVAVTSLTAVGIAVITASAFVVAATAAVGIALGVQRRRSRNGMKQVALNGRETKAPKGCEIKETANSRKLSTNFTDRIIIKDPTTADVLGLLCPDYFVNQPYFNCIFTGNKHLIELAKSLNTNAGGYFTNDKNHFYIPNYNDYTDTITKECDIISVADGVSAIGLNDKIFRSKAGEAEEAFRCREVGRDMSKDTEENRMINSDIIRGNFSAYLAFDDDENTFLSGETVNIYIPGFSLSNMQDYVNIRMDDIRQFSAITDRFDINNLEEYNLNSSVILDDTQASYSINAYRGDCYICLFTQRINRNFNSPSSPYNDKISYDLTWKENYDLKNQDKFADINLGDVNAVQLGMWVTFRIRSNYNLNIRTIDESNVDEKAMTGNPRGFYPYLPMSTEGVYKVPESSEYNKGFTKYLSLKIYATLPKVPYYKNWFGTRIMYSDICVTDAFKNGFRTFRGSAYRDYPRTYGEITKLIEKDGNIIVVFEHGIGIVVVKSLALDLSNHIDAGNVLSQDIVMISDMYGSQWADSIVKSPKGFIYGVDTVAKKIWKTNGQSFECISDQKVLEFLNKNITLGERELTPIIGIRNVKTFYNAFKEDVMFTFYDNTYGFEEKVWNLCYNEKLDAFITFYSWVPSYMENINNIPFSFDRNTSKWISKLGISNSNSSFSEGILLSNNIITDSNGDNIGTLSLSPDLLPDNITGNLYIKYELIRDHFGNKDKFKLEETEGKWVLKLNDNIEYASLISEYYYRNKTGKAGPDDDKNKVTINDEGFSYDLPIFVNKLGKRVGLASPRVNQLVVYLLNIKASIAIKNDTPYEDLDDNEKEIYAKLNPEGSSKVDMGHYESVIAVIPEHNKQYLTTDFWKHGQAGIIDIADKIYPTYWYGKLHPFEFEFIVGPKDGIQYHKIFDNLEIISNHAEPESFHYEIIGDSYSFANDKENMYYRQEKTKYLFLLNGVDILYNRNYIDLSPKQRQIEEVKSGKVIYQKSTLLPLWFAKKDTFNEIEDFYYLKDGSNLGYDFSAKAGGEISYYDTLNEFRFWNHAKAVDINDLKHGRLRGNMNYKEDKWYVLINPLNIELANENQWDTPPYVIDYNTIPTEIIELGQITVPEGVQTTVWKNKVSSEAKLKDKWIKIKIRYKGNKLAVIQGVKTLYRISYS